MNSIEFSNGSAFDAFAEIDRDIGLAKANQFVQRNLPRYGIQAFGSSPKEAATHEAGHAILYAAEQLTVTSARIFETKVLAGPWGTVSFCSGWTECPHLPNLTPISPISEDEQYLRQTLAGWAGEVFALSGKGVRIGSSLDERIAAGMLAGRIYRRTGASIESILAEQYAIVHATLRTHKSAHKKLTKLLLKNLIASTDELSTILADVKTLSKPKVSDFEQAMDLAPMLFLISRL